MKRTLKVGDRVYTPLGSPAWHNHGVIVAIVGDDAWCKWDDDRDSGGHIWPLSLLKPESEAVVETPEGFGAVGDGVTDDSAAFQAYIDAVAVVETETGEEPK